MSAEIGAGHDGTAELVVNLRYQNGTVGPVVLNADIGFALLKTCGADSLNGLRGHSWRAILESLQDV